jgi:uncharacterized membrane protein (UPF0127 family)
MKVTNSRTGEPLATTLHVANNFWTRFKGLLGTNALPSGEGLLIVPCNSVHCVGMRYAIDVLFLAKDGTVLKLVNAMPPGALGAMARRARAVLELPVGTIEVSGTVIGDRLTLPLSL